MNETRQTESVDTLSSLIEDENNIRIREVFSLDLLNEPLRTMALEHIAAGRPFQTAVDGSFHKRPAPDHPGFTISNERLMLVLLGVEKVVGEKIMAAIKLDPNAQLCFVPRTREDFPW